jgi:hypothetical protein
LPQRRCPNSILSEDPFKQKGLVESWPNMRIGLFPNEHLIDGLGVLVPATRGPGALAGTWLGPGTLVGAWLGPGALIGTRLGPGAAPVLVGLRPRPVAVRVRGSNCKQTENIILSFIQIFLFFISFYRYTY